MSYYNLYSVSRTLANQIWNAIKDDHHLRTIILSEGQIIHHLPRDAQVSTVQISVFLYNVMEIPSMRNQPPPKQTQNKPRVLQYLNLRYLIVPLTFNAENDQVVLARIMQLFAEKPVLRGSDLQGSLKDGGEDLRIIPDNLAADDLGKLLATLSLPYTLSLSYSVFPVAIESSNKPKENL